MRSFVVYMLHRYARADIPGLTTLLVEERGSEKPQSNMMEAFAELAMPDREQVRHTYILGNDADGDRRTRLRVGYSKPKGEKHELYGSIPSPWNTTRYASQSAQPSHLPSVQWHKPLACILIRKAELPGLRATAQFDGHVPITSPQFRFGRDRNALDGIRIINTTFPARRKSLLLHFNIRCPGLAYKARLYPRRSNDNLQHRTHVCTGTTTQNVVFRTARRSLIRITWSAKPDCHHTIQFYRRATLSFSDSLLGFRHELSRLEPPIKSKVSRPGRQSIYPTRNLASQHRKNAHKKYYELPDHYFSSDSVLGHHCARHYPVDHPPSASQFKT